MNPKLRSLCSESMAKGVRTYLDLASWRNLLRDYRLFKTPKEEGMRMTSRTCKVFYSRALRFSTGTQRIATPNRTLSVGFKEEEDTTTIREKPIQRAKGQRSKASMTEHPTSSRLEPTAPAAKQYPWHCSGTYPAPGTPGFCLVNWKRITSDQWICELTRPTTEADTVCNGAQPHDFRQIQELEDKSAIRKVNPRPDHFIRQIFLRPTSCKPEAAEPFDGKAQFQNGERENTEGPGQEERLVGLDRPEGCLPLGTNRGGGQEVSTVHMGGEGIRVPVSLLWAQQCSTSLHEATETSHGPPQTEGATEQDDMLLMAESRQDLKRQSQEVLALLRLLGLRINLGKSQLLPTHKLVCLGLTIDTTLMILTLPEEKVQKILPADSSQGYGVREGLVETNWNEVGDDTGGLASSTSLQSAPGLEGTNTEENSPSRLWCF